MEKAVGIISCLQHGVNGIINNTKKQSKNEDRVTFMLFIK